MDYRFETNDSARDFHRKRRAFVIYDGELLFLPHGSELSHFEYCTKLGISREEFVTLTRGYFFDNFICCYKDDFSYDNTTIEEVLTHIQEIALHLRMNVFCIYFGTLPDRNFQLDYYYGRYICGDIV